jgi:RimJ/RimL family protein N-acetyltransferase
MIVRTANGRLTAAEALGHREFVADQALPDGDHVGGKLKHGVLTAEETRSQLAGYRATWSERGYGVFAMRRRDSGAFVGIVGLWDHDAGIGVAMRYAVMPEHRGHGFTKEAAKAVLDFAVEKKIHPVMAVTRESNLASRRILVDLGFSLCEVRETGDRSIAIYQMTSGSPR